MTVTIYGIRNCTTMQKARAWLDAHAATSRSTARITSPAAAPARPARRRACSHDYKTAGAPPALVARFADALGWEKLVNRSGLTFRRPP